MDTGAKHAAELRVLHPAFIQGGDRTYWEENVSRTLTFAVKLHVSGLTAPSGQFVQQKRDELSSWGLDAELPKHVLWV